MGAEKTPEQTVPTFDSEVLVERQIHDSISTRIRLTLSSIDRPAAAGHDARELGPREIRARDLWLGTQVQSLRTTVRAGVVSDTSFYLPSDSQTFYSVDGNTVLLAGDHGNLATDLTMGLGESEKKYDTTPLRLWRGMAGVSFQQQFDAAAHKQFLSYFFGCRAIRYQETDPGFQPGRSETDSDTFEECALQLGANLASLPVSIEAGFSIQTDLIKNKNTGTLNLHGQLETKPWSETLLLTLSGVMISSRKMDGPRYDTPAWFDAEADRTARVTLHLAHPVSETLTAMVDLGRTWSSQRAWMGVGAGVHYRLPNRTPSEN